MSVLIVFIIIPVSVYFLLSFAIRTFPKDFETLIAKLTEDNFTKITRP